MTENIGLSIVICTYNRAAQLTQLLGSIANQTHARLDLEVLIIDNNSRDDTPAVAARFVSAVPDLRWVPEPVQGLSHARNRGLAESAREHVLFLDDDALLPGGFLQHLEQVLGAKRPDLFGGPVLPRFEAAPPPWFPPEIETRRYADAAGFSDSATLSGGNFGIRRDVLTRLGPFDVGLGMRAAAMAFGEDREMVERYRRMTPPAAQRLYYDPALAVEHRVGPEKLTKSYQLRRSYETARARERVFIASGVRSASRSRLLAAGRVALAPLTLGATLVRGRFSARARFLTAFHAWGLAGRFAGAFSFPSPPQDERS